MEVRAGAFALVILLSVPVLSARETAIQATLQLSSVRAAPGDTVAMPVTVSATSAVAGFSFSIDFDEELMEVEAIEKVWINSDGTEWDLEVFHINNDNATPGNTGIAEGYVSGAIIFARSSRSEVNPPPNQEHEIFRILFRVKPAAPPGASDVRFVDGAKPFPNNPSIPNIVTAEGVTAELTVLTAPILIDGLLQIIGDITLFLRGDSDGDGAVDLGDAVFTLDFLFRNGRPPSCLDAADANDDSVVNITDPIATLTFLFLGGDPLPPPSTSPSSDPTPDELSCGHSAR